MSSKNIARFKVGKYTITCAESKLNEFFSYEIGLRDNSLENDQRGHFYLIQSDYFRAFNIDHYGALCAEMINHGVELSVVKRIFGEAEGTSTREQE
jgi:hypothetical protein